MQLTQMSFVLLPICLTCAFWPGALLFLVRYFGVLGAGAIVVVGDFGVATTLLPAALFVGNFFLQLSLGRNYPGQQRVLQIAMPFIVVALYALATAFILPLVFDSLILVYPQKPEPGFGRSVLHFGTGNITQSMYLATDLVFFVCAAIFLAGRGDALAKHFQAYLFTGYAIALICFWQLANKVAGVPFPEAFLFSNPSWAELPDQDFGGVSRIDGPFQEPAVLALNMCGFAFCTGWLVLQGYRHKGLLPLFVLSLICLVLGTSTSGFVDLAAGCLFVAVYALTGAAPAVTARLFRISIPAAAIGIILALLLPIFAPRVVAAGEKIFSGTLEKQQSQSYNERTTMDTDSLGIVVDTYGLGVGFGSNRPSSLVVSLSSQIGILGVGGLAVFVTLLARYVSRARKLAATLEQRMVLQGTAASLIGYTGVAVVSGPIIVFTDCYLSLAMLVAVIANIEMSAVGGSLSRVARPPSPLTDRTHSP